MKIIAMLTRSAGNAEVGSMWTETTIFDGDVRLFEVIHWATEKLNIKSDPSDNILRASIKERLILQIADDRKS